MAEFTRGQLLSSSGKRCISRGRTLQRMREGADLSGWTIGVVILTLLLINYRWLWRYL